MRGCMMMTPCSPCEAKVGSTRPIWAGGSPLLFGGMTEPPGVSIRLLGLLGGRPGRPPHPAIFRADDPLLPLRGEGRLNQADLGGGITLAFWGHDRAPRGFHSPAGTPTGPAGPASSTCEGA